MKKRITAILSSILIILSSFTIPAIAETKSTPAKTSDRWAFRQAYVDMTRIKNEDGTYSFPKLDLTTKTKIYTFIHNLLNLEKIADGAGISGWPAQLTQFTQPMFLELPKDVIGTVGPEDIEIYTVFSNAGSGFKAKLSDEQLDRLYMRENSWINDKDRDVNQYRYGDKGNPISIPDLSKYSAKRFDLTDLALYDENHQIVQPGQKGGAYFKFSIEGALETVNPGDALDPNISPKGYGLRIDKNKKNDLTEAILRYINAGMFHKTNNSGNYDQVPSPPFNLKEFNDNIMSVIEVKESNDGLIFDEFILNVDAADTIIYQTAFALATQFMNIDAKELQKKGINSELYGEMGNMQSTWAAAKDGLIPYFEEALLNTGGVSSVYADAVKKQFLDMFYTPTKPGAEPFHELFKGLTGGSFIQYEKDENGKLIAKRDPATGDFLYEKDFTKAVTNSPKQGGVQTSVYFAFEGFLSELYSGITEDMTNTQVKQILQSGFDSLLEENADGEKKIDTIMKEFRYVSKLEAANAPEEYRTFFPIAIRLKVAEDTNLAATNLVSKPNGCVTWTAERKEGSGETITNGIIRAYNPQTKKLITSAQIPTIKFTDDKKVVSGEVCLGGSIDYIYEFEVNPDPRDPTETTYEDNIYRSTPLDLIAASLTQTQTAGGKGLVVNTTSTLKGAYKGPTTVEIEVVESKTGSRLAKHVEPNLYFDSMGTINTKLSIPIDPNSPVTPIDIIFRVNLPNGNPGNQPNNEVTYTNNQLKTSTVIGNPPDKPDISGNCNTVSHDGEGKNEVTYLTDMRDWGDLTTGQAGSWQTISYLVEPGSEPPQQYKTNIHYNDSWGMMKQDHVKYSYANECVKWSKDEDGDWYCSKVMVRVTEKVRVPVTFRAKIASHDTILWNNRFRERNWIRTGYGVNLGGEIGITTDYDKKLKTPSVAIYRPKDNIHNINVVLKPAHKSNTFSVDSLANGMLSLLGHDGRKTKYQSAKIPFYDSTGVQHGVSNERFINVQRADGVYTVWYLAVYGDGFVSKTGNVLGSCINKGINVKGTMYDDYWVHPSEPGAIPNRPSEIKP